MLDPDSSSSILILFVLLLAHAIFAAAREAIGSVRRSRRMHLIEEGHPAAPLLDNIAEDATKLLTTEQLVLKSLGFFIVAYSAYLYTSPLAQQLHIAGFAALLIITVVAVFVTLLFGELIPKEIGRSYAEPLALALVYPFSWVAFVAAPLSKLVSMIGRLLTGRWDDAEEDSFGTITEDDLRTYVDAGEEEGVLKEEEKEMIYSIFDLDDTYAREVMVPRIDMAAVECNESAREAMQKIVDAGYSRVPVYDDSIDNIIGILYIKDLLRYWLEHNAEPPSIKSLVRPVYYVPESKPVSDLLRELQRKRVHIAIVVDEYGGTAGLVTIEDILEEIVGEIQDEHDAEEFYMQRLSEHVYIFSARMDLDDINDEMDLHLPTDESDTLGGLVYNALGRIPKAGDIIDGASFGVPDVRLTVLTVDGRRINTVKVEQIVKKDGDTGARRQASGEKPSELLRNPRNSISNSS
ncbi:MAG: HlyC/CorC family transporter [Chloroflexi bacterium]|nr:MAG: HlyC/CorC family transporter [Chloroflexota bacterium]